MKSIEVKVSVTDFVETMELISELPGIVSQIESCKFVCEAGGIEMNTSFIRLKEILANLEGGLTKRALDGLTVCQNCGGWLKGGECENCNSPLAAHQ